ncbi:neutral zinc metallopeptidase [Tsukamurella sp. 8F]|uniref:neutral zinc metallopeptidase n=1 Tax=unclassified Tsukamurella TaxID=2633480 RepID=UPI0023B9F5BC|nr:MULTISPECIES: neutral zinc metallopeptidase [unclassified Tsukamurella]MDF0528749.1 neutral zinc metallopeptidase [Tsukamurella sp. 8J]MDF0586584.1 neutral zinc metallopeptidase [Tsukamurella sp. 8F]
MDRPQGRHQGSGFRVPPPRAAAPAPARGETGSYRIAAGFRRPAPRDSAPVGQPPNPQPPGPAPSNPVPSNPVPPNPVPRQSRPQQWQAPQPGRQSPRQVPQPRLQGPHRQAPWQHGPSRAPQPGPARQMQPPDSAAPPGPWRVPQPQSHAWQAQRGYHGRYVLPAPRTIAPYPPPQAAMGWAAPRRAGVATPVIVVIAAVTVISIVLVAAVVVALGRAGQETISAPSTPLPGPGSATAAATAVPGATPTGDAALAANPLYSQPTLGLPRQRCDPVGWPSDTAAGEKFFASITPCLAKAWKEVLATVGLGYHDPQVVVPSGNLVVTPCGVENLASGNVAAFYCSGNETLYMPPKGLDVDHYGDKPIIYIAVFAHEFGHHVQNVTGTLRAEKLKARAVGARTAAGLEFSRRAELQAQCFSGLFVGSIVGTGGRFGQGDYTTAYDDQERGDYPGSPRDHGTSAHAQGWWQRGGKDQRVASCNTWSASSADVA